MENTKVQEVIEKINRGEVTLSFSSIKEFAKSPSHFIRYKLGDKVQTPAMKKGSIIHCAILEPNELDNRYCVLKKEDLPNPDKDFRNSENKTFKEQFELQAISQNKEIITPEEYEIAVKHIELVEGNEVISHYINNLKKREYKISFEFGGYVFNGYIDGIGGNYELDLKTVPDASPDQFKWKIEREKYHWQHYLYSNCNLIGSWFDAFNLLVDGEYGISLHKIPKDKIFQAEREILNLLEKFEQCTETNSWHMNYEFWTDGKGYFEY